MQNHSEQNGNSNLGYNNLYNLIPSLVWPSANCSKQEAPGNRVLDVASCLDGPSLPAERSRGVSLLERDGAVRGSPAGKMGSMDIESFLFVLFVAFVLLSGRNWTRIILGL